MNVYILILLIAICAFLPRYLPWVAWAGKSLPAKIENILNMAPAAVIAAMVFPGVVFFQKDPSANLLTEPYFLASIATFIIMLLIKRLIVSSFAGVAIFILLKVLYAA